MVIILQYNASYMYKSSYILLFCGGKKEKMLEKSEKLSRTERQEEKKIMIMD